MSGERSALTSVEVVGPSRPLTGVPHVPGHKNTAMPLLVAAALARRRVEVLNVPHISDVARLLELLRVLGVGGERCGDRVVLWPSSEPASHQVDPALSRQLRGSVYVLALAAVRSTPASLSQIGGDKIAGRSLLPHIRALRGFGLDARALDGGIEILGGQAQPSELSIEDRGVSATCLAILIASALDGRSIIRDASLELECDDVIAAVVSLGACAHRDGRTIVVRGPLGGDAPALVVPSDQIVWGTYAIAAAMTQGSISAPRGVVERSAPFVSLLEEAGVQVDITKDAVRTSGGLQRPFHVTTGMYPEFPSDLLPQAMALALCAPGACTFNERHYGARYDHVPELRQLGADIVLRGAVAEVRGGKQLRGVPLKGAGIRETAAMILAGLVATGSTTIRQALPIWRAYEALPETLGTLGAVTRVLEESPAASSRAQQ